MKKLLTGMEGLYPASITPFDASGNIHVKSLERLLERNIAEGAAGFFVGGSSAECFLLTQAERLQGYATAAQYKGAVKLIAHIGAMSTAESIELGFRAKAMGYDALAATPPFYFRHSPEAILGYYSDIIAATGMPVMLYNYPVNTGVQFDLSQPAYRKLLTLPGIVGLKHTSYDLHHLERMLDLNPGLVALGGHEDILPGAVALGASGAIGSTFNFMLPLWKRVYDAAVSGRAEESRELAARGNNLIEEILPGGLIAAIKYILTKQGIPSGDARKPFLPLTAEHRDRIDRALEIAAL